ncbi:hypothetical protein [Gordonia rubripertincta]|uniref:Uncharacterized protein n=1 Tax=Gordonia rubripertincta TaxID=36822 RepID=A0ABT4MZ15_GORRU|nr:hypothetical protein [Gordonia rubripertincta]MCZ4552255.1 hypothetical protein [Gordonia rubripertincta]
MRFQLKPQHVAGALAGLFILPVLYIFMVQGVESSTEYSISYSTGETSTDSSSNLGSQIGKALPWFIFALIFGAIELWARKTNAGWPPALTSALAGLRQPATNPSPGGGMRFNPPPNWPPAPAGWTPAPGWQPDAHWPPAPAGWPLWVPEPETGDPMAPPSFPPRG